MTNVLEYFHHIHHENNRHVVHHCGGGHKKIDPKLDYEITHCPCAKHSISTQTAIGHDFNHNETTFEFSETCPSGGYHIESGITQ